MLGHHGISEAAISSLREVGVSLAIGIAAETDAAFAFGHSRAKAVALATEIDAALALGKVKARAIVFADESDAALALGPTVSPPSKYGIAFYAGMRLHYIADELLAHYSASGPQAHFNALDGKLHYHSLEREIEYVMED